MTLKAKLAMIVAAPVYVAFLLLIFTVVFILNIFIFTMKVLGFIEAFTWMLIKTGEVIKLRQFRASLHKADLEILRDKSIKPEQ